MGEFSAIEMHIEFLHRLDPQRTLTPPRKHAQGVGEFVRLMVSGGPPLATRGHVKEGHAT
jgi:hypothetical protein